MDDSLRVPLNRAPNPDGVDLNVGIDHTLVPVVTDPDLPVRGECGYVRGHDGAVSRVIRLREPNDQVLLHEILHVVIDPLGLATLQDPLSHDIIARVEVALWETGWRRTTVSGE